MFLRNSPAAGFRPAERISHAARIFLRASPKDIKKPSPAVKLSRTGIDQPAVPPWFTAIAVRF